MADASLLVDLIISKYLYHLPFYRVIEIYKELGGTISASTINDWLKEVARKVKPLYDLLRAHGLDLRLCSGGWRARCRSSTTRSTVR